jgi:hypothetical protein
VHLSTSPHVKKKKKKRYPKTSWIDEQLEQADHLLFPPRQKHRRGTKTKPKRRQKKS